MAYESISCSARSHNRNQLWISRSLGYSHFRWQSNRFPVLGGQPFGGDRKPPPEGRVRTRRGRSLEGIQRNLGGLIGNLENFCIGASCDRPLLGQQLPCRYQSHG